MPIPENGTANFALAFPDFPTWPSHQCEQRFQTFHMEFNHVKSILLTDETKQLAVLCTYIVHKSIVYHEDNAILIYFYLRRRAKSVVKYE